MPLLIFGIARLRKGVYGGFDCFRFCCIYRCYKTKSQNMPWGFSHVPHILEGEGGGCGPHLDEANVRGLLPEALTADVEAVLADQTGAVSADTAAHVSIAAGWTWTTAMQGGLFAYQDRAPLPYFFGREFQTDS